MKHFITQSLTILLLLLGSSSRAIAQEQQSEQDENQSINKTLQKIIFSGFGDFLTKIDNDDSKQVFEIGQAELSFEYPFSDKTNLSLAIAYNGESFEIGAFFYEHLIQKENSQNSYSFIIGQFDVPFGIDWQVYPSIDRNLISSPLIVSETHDGWNDLGVNVNFENNIFSGSIYTINGFTHECSNIDNNLIISENNYAIGSQITFKIKENLSIGGSIAYIDDKNNLYDMNLYGTDFLWSHKNLSLKAEYIRHANTNGSDKNFHDDGYYLQSKYDFSKFYIVNRISSYRHINEEIIYQYSSGAGITIQENVIARAEWHHETKDNKNELFLQLAFGY